MLKIPKEILDVSKQLAKSSFEAFLVGGCVRDLLLNKIPTDWDIATNARPDQIQNIFPNSFYENSFGTVSLKNAGLKTNPSSSLLCKIEITTYRKENEYLDFRRPKNIIFTQSIKEDLQRRDFTINALALNPLMPTKKVFDYFNGKSDLKKKLVRAVDNPSKRFYEDALRLIRAIRIATELDFTIEKQTFQAIQKNAFLIKKIAQERIREELKKIILSKKPDLGIHLLNQSNLLKFILPELQNCINIKQNRHHIFDVYTHSVLSLKLCPSKKLSVRLASLLHDIAKPQTKRGTGKYSTFYNHELYGARLCYQILKRLRFNEKFCNKVANLILNHMFYYEVNKVTESSIRRLIKNVGKENIKDLIDLRIADRLGSGCPKAKPYKLRHMEFLIDKVSSDPISVKMLQINGNILSKKAKIEKGPKMGIILNILLSMILDNPANNNTEFLIKKAIALNKINLSSLQKKACSKIKKERFLKEDFFKKKHWV